MTDRVLRAITAVVIAVIAVMYFSGFRPDDNTSIKLEVQTQQQEVDMLSKKVSKNEVINRMKFSSKWDVVEKFHLLYPEIKNFEVRGNNLIFKIGEFTDPYKLVQEVEKCREFFADACVIESLYPLSLQVYCKD